MLRGFAKGKETGELNKLRMNVRSLRSIGVFRLIEIWHNFVSFHLGEADIKKLDRFLFLRHFIMELPATEIVLIKATYFAL